MSTWKALRQEVLASPDNSSVAPLAAGAPGFVGNWVSTLGVNAIQVTLFTNQNCTVYVDQTTDTTPGAVDTTDTYNYYIGIGAGFGITVQAVGAYVRVRVMNNSTSLATPFRLNTVLCPIVEALPRSLDEHGNLKVGIRQLVDHLGFEMLGSPNGPMRTADVVRLIGTAFSGATLDGNFWLTSLVGSGTVTPDGSQTRVRTGATLSSSAILYSVRTARYVVGQANYFSAQISQDAPAASNIRRWGAFDANNGAFFELNGTTARVVTRKAGIDTPVPNGSFNGTFGTTLGALGANVQTYEIYFNNRSVYFCIGGELLHTVSTTTTTWSDTLHFPSRIENTNSGITSDLSMYVRSAMINRLGLLNSENTWKYITATGTYNLKYGPGRLKKIINPRASGNNGDTLILYDNTSAALPIITTLYTNLAGGFGVSLDYDLPFHTGLTAVGAGSGANIFYTIVYE